MGLFAPKQKSNPAASPARQAVAPNPSWTRASRRSAQAATEIHAAAVREPWWLFDEYRGQTVNMLHLVDGCVPYNGSRVVMFLSAGPGVGTTSVAWAYARGAAELARRRVLLLAVGSLVPALPAVSEPEPLYPRPAADSPQVFELPVDSLLAESTLEFWQEVRRCYDEVVVDCPAPAQSPGGLRMASYADGVVLVLEAERTRAPVAEQLVTDLRAVRANVVGAVLNRRRLHIPAPIYRRL